MRINKAKEYLESTMLSGKEISEAVGYHEPRYFYTQFKQRVGMTVESYRSSMKENQDEN
ncbi:MAG: helix-turn-helix domain-containing protein [Erysipelotrichaceae bacterium]|nr:helix-turn-helix domain-containing protein [Erysipelotrichaceae bacterium]